MYLTTDQIIKLAKMLEALKIDPKSGINFERSVVCPNQARAIIETRNGLTLTWDDNIEYWEF